MKFYRIFGRILRVGLFSKFSYLDIRVGYCLLNGLGCHIAYESLDGFWEIGTHSRARDGCHMSTFPGQDVIILLVSEPSVFQIILESFSKSSGYR